MAPIGGGGIDSSFVARCKIVHSDSRESVATQKRYDEVQILHDATPANSIC
jgi:hypothetical protein